MLRQYIYDGASLWRVFGQAVVVCLAGFSLLYLVGLLLTRGWSSRRSRWQEERYGRRTKGPELLSSGWRRRLGKDGISFRLRYQNGPLRWLPVGPSFRIPRRLESSHIALMGDTGSGKSTAIRQILRQVQKRGETAIVYDPAMDFIGEFYSPERGDLILNPLDARCPYWDLGAELDREETATTMAAAFLPEKEYEKAFFTDSPRRILAHSAQAKAATEGHPALDGRPRSTDGDGERNTTCGLARPGCSGTASWGSLEPQPDRRQHGTAAGMGAQTDDLCDEGMEDRAQALGLSNLEPRVSREEFCRFIRCGSTC